MCSYIGLMKTHELITSRKALAESKLCAALAALRTGDECRSFLRDLCTPTELQAMAERWTVVEYLKRDLPYREVHRVTGVSLKTISRVAHALANGNGGYATASRRLEEYRQAVVLAAARVEGAGQG